MRLIRAGITDYWQVREPDDLDVARPRTARELMHFWQNELREIEPGYTFGDLVALLRGVEDIDVLSPLLLCDVPAFLEEANRPNASRTDAQPMAGRRRGGGAEPCGAWSCRAHWRAQASKDRGRHGRRSAHLSAGGAPASDSRTAWIVGAAVLHPAGFRWVGASGRTV